ncbi:Arc family DNA-binding protein [Tenuifilum osseticum]|uniref:Arc family DNA-binding protein n=1 Tax=Tenuifilum osseticum TaxID=3374723 RepID=UPI0034E384CF
MSKKKTFVLRIDHEKFAALEKWAADEFRSTNGQIEWIIDQALRKAGRLKKSRLKEKGNQSDENQEG